MSAFGKAAFEVSSSKGDMQNAKCLSTAPLATWLHVYSFSPICRPTTNKCPKYSRHSVRDLVQTASPVELKGALTLRWLPDDFHKNEINPYFFCIPGVRTNPSLLSLSIRRVNHEFHCYQVYNVPFSWKLTEILPWIIRDHNTSKLQCAEAGTVRERRRHLCLEILKCPWTLGWLSSWSQSALLKMVLNFTNAHKALIIRKKIPWVYGWNSVVMKLWDWTETLLH